ncbi:MAG: AmmeMemoRadiSam system protein B [Actinomycetaceae bacterium]|nr:AmmeMemoRadiSam system protein B [Actinomycetaceae bacterium]
MTIVRQPAVSGMFYPADPEQLRKWVDEALEAVTPPPLTSRVVISPHAGYVYSGALAARAIACLPTNTRRVLVLGPCHRVGIDAMALAGADAHATPLGTIPNDPELTELICTHPAVTTAPIVQRDEHSLEVQLPFLQRHLEPGFSVVPVAVGQVPASAVADIIDIAWQADNTAVVVSSDLSHYLPYAQARDVDADTLHRIVTLDGPLVGSQACGAFPVSGLIEFARRRQLSPVVLDSCNSGDTAGDRSRVVGYGALALRPASALPALAYNAIARHLGAGEVPVPATTEQLESDGATFVTLTIDGQLRGCIGSLVAHRPLRDDVEYNARAAAFSDPRFSPLTETELNRISVEVSVLSAPSPLAGSPGLERSEVEARLRPGVDGVTLSHGSRRSTFLPQVWDELANPHDFLAHLLRKGGWPASGWDRNIAVETYQVTSYHLPKR